MRWIGQHIWDFISRFRSDVYLEDISDGTVADDKFLGLDSNNKIVKEAIAAGLSITNATDDRIVTSTGGTGLNAESTLTWDGEDLTVVSGGTIKPELILECIAANNKPSKLTFYKNRTGTNSDFVGQISFTGKDNGGASQEYANIEIQIVDATHSAEAGKMDLKVSTSNGVSSTRRAFLSGTGSNSANDIDVAIGYGSTSETTVAGSLTTEGGIFINNNSYINLVNSSGYGARINNPDGTANRTITLPNAAGTVQLQGSVTGQSFQTTLKVDDLYILYVSSQNIWYHTGYAGQTFGSAIGTESDSTAMRAASYVAPTACKVNRVVIAFYTTSGSADLEFQVTKIPLVDNSTANVTCSAMTHNNINMSMSVDTNYVKTMTMTGGGSDDNHLAAGQAFTLAIRRTDASGTRILYGNCFAEIELI